MNNLILKYLNQEKKIKNCEYKDLLKKIEYLFNLNKNSYKISFVLGTYENPLEIEIESEKIFEEYRFSNLYIKIEKKNNYINDDRIINENDFNNQFMNNNNNNYNYNNNNYNKNHYYNNDNNNNYNDNNNNKINAINNKEIEELKKSCKELKEKFDNLNNEHEILKKQNEENIKNINILISFKTETEGLIDDLYNKYNNLNLNKSKNKFETNRGDEEDLSSNFNDNNIEIMNDINEESSNKILIMKNKNEIKRTPKFDDKDESINDFKKNRTPGNKNEIRRTPNFDKIEDSINDIKKNRTPGNNNNNDDNNDNNYNNDNNDNNNNENIKFNNSKINNTNNNIIKNSKINNNNKSNNNNNNVRTPGENFKSKLKKSQVINRTPGNNFFNNKESSESMYKNQIKNSTDDGSRIKKNLIDSNISTSSMNQRRKESLTPNNQIKGSIIIDAEKYPTKMKTQINFDEPILYNINIINNSSIPFPKETYISCIKSNNQDNLFINDTLVKNGEEIGPKENVNVTISLYFKKNKIAEGKNCVKLILKNKNGIINSNEPSVEVTIIDDSKNIVNSYNNQNNIKDLNEFEENSYNLLKSQK